MNNSELQDYYNNQLEQLKIYLDSKLTSFKDAQQKYLSSVVAVHIENARIQFEKSNKLAIGKFNKSKIELSGLIGTSYPKILLETRIKMAKNIFESSLKFNKNIFENSVSYYENLLKKQT
ncbi:MAG: hypothetical protein NTW62_01565 [Candidatus Nomurabacteria bacterium]|nr:hypothetical protein [Candidatus Nomurabacteria bacterium]